MICLCMVYYSIRRLYCYLRFVCWVYLSLWVRVRFLLELSILLCIWGVESSCESSMRSFTSWIIVDMYYRCEMSSLLLRSPDHCLLHHLIISDITLFVILIWIDNHSLYFLSAFICLLITSFLIFVLHFIHFLHRCMFHI